MSGGSYNYLCHKTVEDIMTGGMADLQDMADRLAGLGYANDAAKETVSLLLTMRAFVNYAETVTERLEQVWKNVEWWDSADRGEDAVKGALAEYRKVGVEP